MINLNRITFAGNRARLIAHLRTEILTPENYGTGDGQWTLTEIAQMERGKQIPFFQAIAGDDPDSGKPIYGGQIRDIDGGEYFLFRLQVLSRQACCRSASGEPLGQMCAVDELPVEGDVVEWKSHKRPSETGVVVTASDLRTWSYRGIRPHIYVEFRVDRDGCIMVPFRYALPMMQKHGERLVFPERESHGGSRLIANWRFREVPRDWRNPAPRLVGSDEHDDDRNGNDDDSDGDDNDSAPKRTRGRPRKGA